MLSLAGLIIALLLLIYLTMRGMNLLVAAPLCALVITFAGSQPLFPTTDINNNFVGSYMGGFTDFLSSWFFMFLLGSIFGKLMEDTGAASSIARWIVGKLGMKYAALSVVLACAILTYGGVSVFVVAFTAYPIALQLFRESNLPRRFIPATMAFGSVTFTMTSAGSPEIQNWIPIKFLGTTPYAAWEVSMVVAVMMAGLGLWWLSRMLTTAIANGEHFSGRPNDPEVVNNDLPKLHGALLPVLAVLIVSFMCHESLQQYALIVALLSGCCLVWLLNRKYVGDLGQVLSVGSLGALIAIGNTSAVVGFGAVAKASPAFNDVVFFMTSLPGHELISAALAVTVIAALTGSASGGQSIALPILAPHYLDLGVDPDALHRVVAISSGALDSLPHNGYVVTTVRAICGETHKDAYGPICALTVVIPLFGTLVAIALLILFS